MSAKRKPFKVRLGTSHITVSPWTHPSGAKRWRIAWRPTPGANWKYQTFGLKDDAEAEAEKKLERMANGTNGLADLPAARRRFLEAVHAGVSCSEEKRLLDFVASLHKSAKTADAVERFLAGRVSRAGEETPYLSQCRGILEQFAGHFKNNLITDIHLPDLQSWFVARTDSLGWKRKRDIRALLVQFWRWAIRDGIGGQDPISVAERLPEVGGQHGERTILSLEEFKGVARNIKPEWRAWLVLGCFAGMRPEEICPNATKRRVKRGLLCEEIDWQFGVIRIAPDVSKVKTPRVVPLSDACRAWLDWANIRPGMTGPVCLSNPAKKNELARLGSLLFADGWPADSCRHSYGSYRNAQIRSLAQVAEEMGTSVTMLHRHYHNPRATEEGEAWFAVRPAHLVPIRTNETAGAA